MSSFTRKSLDKAVASFGSENQNDFRRQQIMLKMSANVEELLNSRHSKCSFYLDQEMLFRTVSKKLDIAENSDDHRKTTEVFGAKWEIRQKNFVKSKTRECLAHKRRRTNNRFIFTQISSHS